jgi:hypothetical protein
MPAAARPKDENIGGKTKKGKTMKQKYRDG